VDPRLGTHRPAASSSDRRRSALLEANACPADAAGVTVSTPRGRVKVDAIDISPAETDPRSGDPNDVRYALGHAWAITTAEDMEIVAVPNSGAHPQARAVLAVAAPGPRVATKLKSAMNRGVDKEAIDLLDIVTLVTDPTGGPTALGQLRSGSSALAVTARAHADHWFHRNAAATLRSIKRLPEGRDVQAPLIADVGTVLLDALAPSAQRPDGPAPS
jgi:azurin